MVDHNLLQRKKLFLFDLDGTLYLGDRLFEGVRELLSAIRARGGQYRFLTNNSSRSVEAYVEKFTRLGVSMGNVFLIPWTYLPESGDWTQLLRDLGFHTVAMALRNDSVRLDDPRLAAEEKLAIVMGTEGDGLASSTIASCDYTVRIPMYHGVDSLNVAAASAVAFYELGLPPLNEKED